MKVKKDDVTIKVVPSFLKKSALLFETVCQCTYLCPHLALWKVWSKPYLCGAAVIHDVTCVPGAQQGALFLTAELMHWEAASWQLILISSSTDCKVKKKKQLTSAQAANRDKQHTVTNTLLMGTYKKIKVQKDSYVYYLGKLCKNWRFFFLVISAWSPPDSLYVGLYTCVGWRWRVVGGDPPYMVCVAPFPGLYCEWWPLWCCSEAGGRRRGEGRGRSIPSLSPNPLLTARGLLAGRHK